MKALSIALTLTALAACQTAPPPAQPEQTAACPVIDSRNWSAHINAMPGPGAQRTLIVSGQIDLPTPGHTVALTAGAADRSATPVQQIVLSAQPPTGMVAQVITSVDVRYEGPAIAQQYRGVRVICGGRELAQLEVIVAH